MLGGFDSALLSTDTAKSAGNLPLSSNTSSPLQLTLSSLVAEQLPQSSAQQLVPTPITLNIDSAVSQLWLPPSVCQLFSDAFGLTYDNSTDLYLVNSTRHTQLKSSNPLLTFQFKGAGDSTFNIIMQYDAFDMAVGIPLYNDSTAYFPIRNASSESQYTLGRTFLQEAYVVVDWERSNFTIGQVQPSSSQNIVAIMSKSSTTTPSPSTFTSGVAHTDTSTAAKSKQGLSSGAIAGIVVAVVLLIAIGLGAFFITRRRRRSQRPTELEANSIPPPPGIDDYATEKIPEKSGGLHVSEAPIYEMSGISALSSPSELASTPRNEMDRPVLEGELMGTPIIEMLGSEAGSELDVSTLDSRTHSPKMRPSLRHTRYLSLDGSSMRLAELSSDTESEVDVSEIGSRPGSPRMNSDRSRYLSVDGAVSGPLIEEIETVPLPPQQVATRVSSMQSGDEVDVAAQQHDATRISPMQSEDHVDDTTRQQDEATQPLLADPSVHPSRGDRTDLPAKDVEEGVPVPARMYDQNDSGGQSSSQA